MDASFVKRIYQNLVDRKTNLTTWVEASPASEIETRLLSGEPQVVAAELQSIDQSLCCIEEGTFGICEVCQGSIEPEILELDYTACVCLDDLSAHEKRQLEAELEFSQAIQKASMHQESPVIPDVEVAAFSRPARIVSGDFFDFFPFKDGSQGFAIADVVGHGVSAGMLMSSVQTALRLLGPESNSPVSVIERIDRLLLHNINFTTFVTLFLGSYDPRTHELTYANAGHNPPLLFQAQSGAVVQLAPTGTAAGLIEGLALDAKTIRI
jgi:RNA polymerase-binding transcription factor DksA